MAVSQPGPLKQALHSDSPARQRDEGGQNISEQFHIRSGSSTRYRCTPSPAASTCWPRLTHVREFSWQLAKVRERGLDGAVLLCTNSVAAVRWMPAGFPSDRSRFCTAPEASSAFAGGSAIPGQGHPVAPDMESLRNPKRRKGIQRVLSLEWDGSGRRIWMVGWGTWIRTKTARVRVGSSTVKLSPKRDRE